MENAGIGWIAAIIIGGLAGSRWQDGSDTSLRALSGPASAARSRGG